MGEKIQHEQIHKFIEQVYQYAFRNTELPKEKASITEDILSVLVDKNISVKDALTALEDAKKILVMYVKC